MNPSSKKPFLNSYLIRAFREYLIDSNAQRIHILIDATQLGTGPWQSKVVNNALILNVAPHAVGHFSLDQELMAFNCRFNGVDHRMLVPISAIVGISNGKPSEDDDLLYWTLPPMPVSEASHLKVVSPPVEAATTDPTTKAAVLDFAAARAKRQGS